MRGRASEPVAGDTEAPRRRLQPLGVSLPTGDAPVVECQRSAAYAEAAVRRVHTAPPELWSTTALCGYDPERASGSGCADEAPAPPGGARCSCSRRRPRDATPGSSPGGSADESPSGAQVACERQASCSTADAGPDETWSRAIVFFLPSATGDQDDPFHRALFEVVAKEIAGLPDVDCRRVAWPPTAGLGTDFAVACVLLALQQAVAEAQALSDPDQCPEHFRVILVGHSFGGAVAIQAACELPRLFQGEGGPSVTVAGVCTIDTLAHQEAKHLRLDLLQNARALLIAGGRGDSAGADAADQPEASRELFALLPATRKEMVAYCPDDRGGGGRRGGQMVVRLVEFVIR